ncbi:MAG: hypothetical protein PHV37_04625 [Candidatus Gastranaerophilales bacterium]|nr:hypothetical protein [Candidatus Gastranaerophilales bacterium]
MSKEKSTYLSSFKIFFESVKIYFTYLDKFMNYMTFPIFGQLIGIVMLLGLTYWYSSNLPKLMMFSPVFDNVMVAMSILLVITLPFFFLFCKAFYDYLIAMAALNSISCALFKKSTAKKLDTTVHNELIQRKAFNYILLVILMSLIYMVCILPFFWIVLIAFIIYSSLTLQVFALEENMGPVAALKRSITLINGNFWVTTILLGLLFFFTYLMLPHLIVWALDEIDVVYYLANPIEKIVKALPLDIVETSLRAWHIGYVVEPIEISRNIVMMGISSIVIAYTLPLRSCACTILYKKLDDEKIEENRQATKIDGRKEIKKIMKRETKKYKSSDGQDESNY